jgi:rhodanese-related sulfurtransferase
MMQRATWAALFLFVALLLGACGQAVLPEEESKGFAKNADGYVDISVDQLASIVADPDLAVVNVHIPYEGEIPETDLFVSFDEIQDHLDELPAKDAPIVLYCRSGGMSMAAAEALVAQGYSNVMELDGGFSAWQAQGHELLDKKQDS